MSHGPIALTAAAAVLVGPAGVTDPSEHRSQTQITVERRLYDIGSILCSLGLVDRVYIKKRQPAFEWVYGWRPGDSHPPPELAVAVMSRQPAPPLPIMPRRITGEGGGSASGGASRSGGGGKRGSGSRGGGGKRQRGEQGGAASAGMLPLAGLPPYGLPPMPPLGSPFPQNVLAAMSGLTPPPGTGGGGAGTGIGTTGSGGVDAGDKAQLAMAQLLSNPALFNPMAMGMSLPGIMPGADLNLTAPFGFGPGSEANNIPLQGSMTGLNVSKEGGLKAGGEGDAAAGANGGEGTVAAPAVPGSEGVPGEPAGLSPDMATMQQLAAFMWPPMFMHPAMLQMQQMAAAAGGTVGTGGGGEGGGQQDGTQSLPPPIPPTEGMDAALGGGGFGMQFLNPLLQGMVPLPGQLPTAPGVPGAAEAGAAEAGGGENHQAPPSSAPEPATDAPQDVSGGGPAEGDAQKEPNPPETGIEASNPEGQ